MTYLEACVSSSSKKFPQLHQEPDSCIHQTPAKKRQNQNNSNENPSMKEAHSEIQSPIYQHRFLGPLEGESYNDAPLNPHILLLK
jgi:hypothetical protein